MGKYINWEEIQNFYDLGNSWRDILKKFKISNNRLSNAIESGLFKTRSKSESVKLYTEKNPRRHSEETKNKISEIRKRYLQENPDKVPYKLNHSSKESYPEKYFTEVFKNEGIEVVKSFYIGIYELDFSIPDKRIDIEVDGSQHYYDEKIAESDRRRNKFLEDDGWDIIRINWSEYQKLSFDHKKDYIFRLKSYINKLIDTKPTFEVPVKKIVNTKEIKIKQKRKVKDKTKKEQFCIHCGSSCTWKKDRCESCYRILSRKVNRPTLDQLQLDIESLGYSGTGRKYGVSDNAIRKWLKQYSEN